MDLSKLFNREPEAKRASTAIQARVDLPTAPFLDTTAYSLSRYANKSELVYSCIAKKADVACDPELIIQRKNKKGEWEPEPEHPALMPLMNPNPNDDGEGFLKAWIASQNIAGWFAAEIVPNGAGQPVQLWPLRVDCLYPQYKETTKGRMLDYYAYRINGIEVRYAESDLLIHRLHSRGSMYSGMSPLAVALASVDADISATEYVRDFFNNDGTPSGILKITGRNLSDDEAARLKQKWSAMYARNGKGRGGVAILDDSADYETVGAKLNELESETLTSIDETRICMAFGVPPVLIGAYVGLKNVNQKASFKGAMEEFWNNTMSPELKGIRNFLTRKYLPFFESEELIRAGKIRFFWDISSVDALQEDIDAIFDRMALGYKTGFVKLDEARAAVNLDPVGPELGGEEFYKAPAPVAPGQEEPIEEEEKPKQLAKSILDADTLEKKTFEFEGLVLGREPTILEMSCGLKAIADSYDSTALAKVIAGIRSELIDQAVASVTKLSAAEVHTLNLVPPPGAYKRVKKPIERAVQDGRNQITQAKALPISDIIERLVELTISRVISAVSSAAVDISVSQGILGNEGDEDAIRQELEDRSEKQFDGIARQTINSAVNAGRREEMEARKDEIAVYVYSAILDANTCNACAEWDGKMSEKLEDLPETPNADCSGGANCRCFVISVFEGDSFEAEGNEVR